MLKNETLGSWATLLGNLQSPQQYNAWALLSAAAACATRRISFKRGPIIEYANMMVMLVGDPGARKSVCLTLVKPLVKDLAFVKFGPTTTSGHYQGLITTMKHSINHDTSVNEFVKEGGDFGVHLDANIDWDKALDAVDERLEDSNAVWVVAAEALNFFGQSNLGFCGTLCELYDGYTGFSVQLKRASDVLEYPYLNLIGAATPANIAAMFPDNALDQGIASRMVFVYGEQHGEDYWPEEIPDEKFIPFKDTLHWIGQQEGEMAYTKPFREQFNDYMQYIPEVNDIRLISYAKRRQKHMVKTAMCLALLRRSMTLDIQDLDDAHHLLQEAEKDMAEALGEFGMSPEALARRRITTILKEADEPLSAAVIKGLVGKDITINHISAAVRIMVRLNQVKVVDITDPLGGKDIGYVWRMTRSEGGNLVNITQEYKVPYPVNTSTDKAVRKQLRETPPSSIPEPRSEQDTVIARLNAMKGKK